MPITALDIKIRKSQRLTDNPDGGGRMVAAEVVDGELNNLFPDISTQDRVSGRVSMRKGFVHIDTPDTSVLYGAVGVIMEAPEDDNVSMLMFSTGSYSDVRSDARNRIENYITKGVESRFVLFGDHFIGQRAITMYCLKDAPTPEINETYCLSVEATGYPANIQYVRVLEMVSRVTQTFIDDQGAFERDVIIINASTALLYDFDGLEANRITSVKPPTRIRTTNVADASSYYGIKPLQLAAAIGDLLVKVDTPYVPLVPATQAETPIVDVLAGMGTLSFIQAGPSDGLGVSDFASFSAGVPAVRYLGNTFLKGSVTVAVDGTTLTDDGQGDLQPEGGASPWGGNVDYLQGSVSLSHSIGDVSASFNVTATAAGAISAQGYSDQTEITPTNRQNNYIFGLTPLPSAGTVVVDYRALGKWIRLYDNGTGQLAGSPGQGSGSVNYATGSVTVTLGALPDLDSSIIVSYGTGVQTSRRDGDTAIQVPALQFVLASTAVKPGSVNTGYLVSGAAVTVVDDGAGVMKIGATTVGSINYGSGEVLIRPPTLPDVGSQITTNYIWSASETATFTPAIDGSGNAVIDLGGAVRAGGVRLTWTAEVLVGFTPTGVLRRLLTMVAKDDGAGVLKVHTAGGAAWPGAITDIGTVVYSTGIVTIRLSGNVLNNIQAPVYQATTDYSGRIRWRVTAYNSVSNPATVASGSPVSVEWQQSGALDTADTDTIGLPQVEFDLTPTVIDTIVPGAVRFTFRDRTYVDRSGSLYYDISPTSGSGTFAGTIDYVSGKVRVTDWSAGGSNDISVTALLTRFTEAGTSAIYFRTPGSPLRPASFTLRATTLAGVQLTAAADNNGTISGARVEGEINWSSGSAFVRFGEMVAAAGNESEPWYDPAAVVGGLVWRPLLVLPETVYFGVVVYRSIPLNPAILGLDPVRLPEDGRIVPFRPGQTVLVHDTKETSIASPAAGQVVNLLRPNLSRVEVRDSLGVPILSTWYVTDKSAGTLTFSNPLNLAGYTLPVVIRDRVEDRALVADVQITGEIAINRALAHDYPVGSSISTCLILGEANGSQDLQARVENMFDQATWTGVFSETLIGDATDSQYNDVVYPFVVDNGNAITERWAIRFTSATNFELIGESSGIIATGDTLTDFAPLNPRTAEPYFLIDKDGWGGGWSSGNALRFNTIGGLAPVWFIRTTLAGEMELPVDGFRFEAIGDANP